MSRFARPPYAPLYYTIPAHPHYHYLYPFSQLWLHSDRDSLSLSLAHVQHGKASRERLLSVVKLGS